MMNRLLKSVYMGKEIYKLPSTKSYYCINAINKEKLIIFITHLNGVYLGSTRVNSEHIVAGQNRTCFQIVHITIMPSKTKATTYVEFEKKNSGFQDLLVYTENKVS